MYLFHYNYGYPYFAEKLEHGQLSNEKREEMLTGLYLIKILTCSMKILIVTNPSPNI